MEAIDETLRRTAENVARYQVPDRIVTVARDSLAGMPEQRRHGCELDALHDALLYVAEAHAGPHNGECPTCHAIGNALAVALAVVRVEVDVEFEQRI